VRSRQQDFDVPRRRSEIARSGHSAKYLLQRRPRLCRSIVKQDLQHWKPAKQLGAGFSSGLFAIEMSLEVAVDNKREAVGRWHVRPLNAFRLTLDGSCKLSFSSGAFISSKK
jgi:hypothetical protein